jgi:ATP-dependent RNA helicase RhlE
LPNIPETYVHRIGRTGRAGASGKAVSFCEFEERAYLKDIQKLISIQIPVNEQHPFPAQIFVIEKKETQPRQPRNVSREKNNRNFSKRK